MYPDVKKAEMDARERLLDFRERILNGEKFNLLATLYSDCPSAMRGGELGMASKSLYWPAFSDAAMALKEGQVSPIVETPDGFHIIEVLEKKGDMFNARHILMKPEYTSVDREKGFKMLDSLKVELQNEIAEMAGIDGALDIRVIVNEQIRVARPITLEDRLKYLVGKKERMRDIIEAFSLESE